MGTSFLTDVPGPDPGARHPRSSQERRDIERIALDPHGGVLTPDPDRPGLGMELRTADAERYRRG
jgi:hypothetical protein